jgi:hypothetical protein
MTQLNFEMNAGMLWFDNDPKTALTAKIEKAVDYYRHKYGRDPNLCLIHPSMLPSDGMAEKDNPATGRPALSGAKGVVVRPYRPVLPGHLWIGIEEKH